jgi:ABC-2 type transport system ATP-binding protein
MVNGRPAAELEAPMSEIGALLEAHAVHPKRSARNHLRALAATTGIGDRRVAEVIELVGLEEVAKQAVGGFSLGMRQRLGIASALLGDPETIMLDEPVNGLDPEGMVWIRRLLRGLADEGRTVFVSSHLINELSMIADHYIIIGRGRMIADLSADELKQSAVESNVRVRTPAAADLRAAMVADGVTVTSDSEQQVLTISGLSAEKMGSIAHAAGIVLYELTPNRSTLEDVFMDLTRDAVEFRSHDSSTGEAA